MGSSLNLKKLILVGIMLSIVYVVFYLEIQKKNAGTFVRNIPGTPEISSNNKNLLKNESVANLAELVEGAIKEVSDMKETGKNVKDTTTAAMLPKHKNTTGTETVQELSAEQRAKYVQGRCKRFLKAKNRPSYNVTYKYEKKVYMTSRRYNLTFCINLKTASTNVRRVLYALDNNFNGDINSIRKGTVYSYGLSRVIPFQQVLAEKDHVSVMFIREPMERLLSAYRDNKGNTSGTFKDYLQLILDTKTDRLNRHMYPYYDACRPCEKQYKFIGLQKTFPEDMKVVLKKINALGRVNIPERVNTGYSQGSEKVLQDYYKDVPNDMIHRLWEKYKKDYFIFGFPYPSHLMNKTR